MTAEEQRDLLAREAEPCVSYRRRVAKAVPVALVLLAAAGSLPAAEPDALPVDAGDEELISIVVGGASRITESLFETSALPEPVDREPTTALSDAKEPER
ncbi:MAG: hypothetical protein KDI37_11120 [Xanthomonadales bacterium]|nr:hypothetical protein [Xanthomonadales bacterium]